MEFGVAATAIELGLEPSHIGRAFYRIVTEIVQAEKRFGLLEDELAELTGIYEQMELLINHQGRFDSALQHSAECVLKGYYADLKLFESIIGKTTVIRDPNGLGIKDKAKIYWQVTRKMQKINIIK